jgi:chromosome segregation ATPase
MLVVSGLAGLGFAGLACAQVERTAGGANAQIVQQYQQAAAERSALQSANAKLKKDLDDQKKQLDDALKQLGAYKAKAGANVSQVASALAAKRGADEEVEKLRVKLEELLARFRNTVGTLAGSETERGQLKQQLAATIAQYDVCAQRNYDLYTIGNEALTRLEHQGVLDVVSRKEPFTRLTRTRLENLVDEYRQRTEELRLPRAGGTPLTGVAAPAGGQK